MGNLCRKKAKVTTTVTQQSQENESFQPDDGIYIPAVSPTSKETDLPGGNDNDDFKSSGYSTSQESHFPLPDYSEGLPDRRSQYKEPEENRGLSKEHQRIIKRQFRYLKDELDPEFLLDYFIQEKLFTEDQGDEVRSAGRRRNQVDLFLRFLLRSRRSTSYSQFLDILDQIDCGHIRTKLESKEDLDPIGFTSKGIESTRQQLQNHREEICSSIDSPSDIAEYFVQYEEFTIDEYELVIHESTRRLKAEKLLDTLLKDSHLQRGFDILNYALQDQGYSTIEYQESEENCISKKKRIPDSSGHFSKFQSVVDEERCFSHRLEEANEMRITIACTEQSKRKKEKKMVKKAKQYKVLSDLNDALICDAECLLTNVDQGSIVIRIKGCKKGAIESLFKSPNGIGVSKVLQKIFSHPKLAKIFDQSAIFHVTIDILPTPVKDITEKPKSLQQIICTNFDFLTEELDALRFLDLDIFTEKEKRDILQARPLSRSECTKLMLGYICEKNENDIDKFIHEIKQKKRFVWDHIFSPESKECLDDQILSTFYIDFVENLSPFKITHYCIERGIIDKSIVERTCFKTRQREQCAKMLLQDLFKKSYDARNEFLHILKAFDQTPSAIQLTSKVADQVHANEKVTLPGLKFQGTYCLAASERTEPPKAADRDQANEEVALPELNFQGTSCLPELGHTETPKEHDEDRKEDAESGYHSLNSTRRSQTLRELESLKESNEKTTLQLDDVAEEGTMALDHDAEEHSLIKDVSRAHLKQHPTFITRPMAVPRCLPVVHFDHDIYDSNTRPRRSRSMLGKVPEDVTEVSVKPSGNRSLSFNFNRHSDCSRHSLQITNLSENFN